MSLRSKNLQDSIQNIQWIKNRGNFIFKLHNFWQSSVVPIHLTSDLMQLFIATFGSAADIAIVYFQQGSTKWMGEKGRFVIYRIENL